MIPVIGENAAALSSFEDVSGAGGSVVTAASGFFSTLGSVSFQVQVLVWVGAVARPHPATELHLGPLRPRDRFDSRLYPLPSCP